MDNTLIATATVTIKAPKSKVWEALTTPRILKQFFTKWAHTTQS